MCHDASSPNVHKVHDASQFTWHVSPDSPSHEASNQARSFSTHHDTSSPNAHEVHDTSQFTLDVSPDLLSHRASNRARSFGVRHDTSSPNAHDMFAVSKSHVLAKAPSHGASSGAHPRKRPHNALTRDRAGNMKKLHTKGVNIENANLKNDPAAATIEDDDILAKGSRWSDEDKTKLFEWLLGSEADKLFKTHNKNLGYVYKKVNTQPYLGRCAQQFLTKQRGGFSPGSTVLTVFRDSMSARFVLITGSWLLRSSPVEVVMPIFLMRMTLIPMGMWRTTKSALKELARRASRLVHCHQSSSIVGTKMDGILFFMTGRFLLESTSHFID